MEDFDNIIQLTDENGEDVDFEFLDLVELRGAEYAVLLPCEEDAHEVFILKLLSSNEDDKTEYVGIEDEQELAEVFQLFRQHNSDRYNFTRE